jgi:hypothetical protein
LLYHFTVFLFYIKYINNYYFKILYFRVGYPLVLCIVLLLVQLLEMMHPPFLTKQEQEVF